MITDEQKITLLQQYKDRGILKKEIRSYEVSLWSLQDEFITVLKWSDAEQIGRIENPKMTLNIDGTQKLTFSIPMYYRQDGKLIENPNWYTIQKEKMLRGLRKLKVIFNKGKEYEILNEELRAETRSLNVYEFVITNVVESHDNDILTCNIEAEGLAFQELGKIGYKISLSLDNFEEIYRQWYEYGYWLDRKNARYLDFSKHEIVILLPVGNEINPDTIYLQIDGIDNDKYNMFKYNEDLEELEQVGYANRNQPLANVKYWCEEGCGLEEYNTHLDSRAWYYDIRMDQSAFSDSQLRSRKEVYEDPYVVNWNQDLQPISFSELEPKARIIEIENSNLYNITQTIAEQFGIYCRYEYRYNDNYQIIGRTIIFYNTFTREDTMTSFTYPYSASKTERVIECADVTTKLYVLSADNDSILEGQSTIMDVPANRSEEDYILNFDYLKEIGAITNEQYKAIDEYEKDMHRINEELSQLQRQQITYEAKKIELEAKKKTYENSIELEAEQIYQNQQKIRALDLRDGDEDGCITISDSNCDYCIIQTDATNKKYISLITSNKGILQNTINIYTTMNGDGTLANPITGFNCIYDDYNNLSRIELPASAGGSVSSVNVPHVYVTYTYKPVLYFTNIINTWGVKQTNDTENLNKVNQELGPEDKNAVRYSSGLYGKYNKVLSDIQIKQAEKQEKIAEFERLMGPAIREGYWQPENYSDYGDFHIESGTISNTDITNEGVVIAWDSTLFDNEDKLYYKVGIDETQEYYPCIDLETVFSNGIPTDLDEYSLVWYSNSNIPNKSWNNIQDLTVFHVNSKAVIRFLKTSDNKYKPILMLTGAKTIPSDELTRMMSYEANSDMLRLEKYNTYVENGELVVSQTEVHEITSNNWLYYTGSDVQDCIVYPRIRISSLALKTDTSNLAIQYGSNLLSQPEDYYINTRDTYRNENYYTEYYITLKPESLIKCGYNTEKNVTIYYVLSNANVAIYLDALKVSKENAYPKVSYNISANILDMDLANKLYSKLARIVMINDTDLKFENVFGYISSLDLDLDRPWQDSVEVKNYTSKFEDLFSTIVAQTENMKQNEEKISSLLGGKLGLSEKGVENTIAASQKAIWEYLDSHFDGSELVEQKLNSIFTEAGDILAQANQGIKQIGGLTLNNARILSGFAQQVANGLAANVVPSQTRPTTFKAGDIWIQTDENGNVIGRYVATSNSSDVVNNDTGFNGYVRTYDGTLASIEGAALKVDSQAGTIDIKAVNNISIASEDVNVIGNRAVNIGGTQINIASSSTTSSTYGGITLVASSYDEVGSHISDGQTSHIIINPKLVEIASATLNFLSVTAGLNGQNIISTTAAALHISAIDGIWMGTNNNNGIRLFAGDVPLDEHGAISDNNVGGAASVELNSEHLILGYSSIANDGSVIKLDKDGIVMGVGNMVNSTSAISSTAGLIGAKFTKNSIGFATTITDGNNNITGVNAILMNDNGVTVGSGNIDVSSVSADLRSSTASYVRIAASGIDIGSQSDIYINTKNLKLQTNATNTENNLGTTLFAIGNDVSSITAGTSISDTLSDVNLLLNNNGLYINGNANFNLSANSNIKMTAGSSFTFATTGNSSAFTLDTNGALISAGTMQLQSHNSRFIIDNTGLYFNAMTNENDTDTELQITKNGTVINNGTFGPWQLTLDGFQSSDGTMGWKKTNTQNVMSFWIYHNGKPAFYYQNGKVYIRELILSKELKYSGNGAEFGLSSAEYTPASGGTSSGGTAPSTPTQTWESFGSLYVHYLVVNGQKTDTYQPHTDTPICQICQGRVYGWN